MNPTEPKVTPEGIASEPMKEFLSVCEGECDHAYCWSQKRGEFERGKATYEDGIKEASRIASYFTVKPGASIHPDIPWDKMNENAKMIAHTTAQQISWAISESIVKSTPEPLGKPTEEDDLNCPNCYSAPCLPSCKYAEPLPKSEEAQLPPLDFEEWYKRELAHWKFPEEASRKGLARQAWLAALSVGKGQGESCPDCGKPLMFSEVATGEFPYGIAPNTVTLKATHAILRCHGCGFMSSGEEGETARQNVVDAYLIGVGKGQDAADERMELQTIDERDRAEEALSQAYFLITGRSPEWSNLFGHDDALEDIDDAQKTLRLAVGKAGGDSAWIEIKEGCEMPEDRERVWVAHTRTWPADFGTNRFYASDGPLSYWTHWQRILPPYVAPKLKEGEADDTGADR